MQSGISASKELKADFGRLLSADDAFALLVSIEGESLVPAAWLPGTPASSFGQRLALLQPHVRPDAPLYMLLRRHEAAPRLVAVTYVPDAAPVRQKMLFASTRLSLVRELGSEHFRDALFLTTPAELTEDGFQKLDRHARLAAPLTDEEQALGQVKRAEQEAGAGTGVREIHLSKSLTMPVADDAIAALKDLGPDGGRTVTMLSINPKSELVELVPEAPRPSSVAELVAAISATEPRFTFFRFAHAHGGAAQSPLLFVYSCPAGAGAKSIKTRMMYPLMKRAVLQIADTTAGLTIDKKFEIEDPAELTDELVLEELHPKAAPKQGFSRPKRPGR